MEINSSGKMIKIKWNLNVNRTNVFRGHHHKCAATKNRGKETNISPDIDERTFNVDFYAAFRILREFQNNWEAKQMTAKILWKCEMEMNSISRNQCDWVVCVCVLDFNCSASKTCRNDNNALATRINWDLHEKHLFSFKKVRQTFIKLVKFPLLRR